jgi:release factor glutamine methyltransferase
MNIQELLRFGETELQSTSPTPLLDTQILCEYFLTVDKKHLLMHSNDIIDIKKEKELLEAIKKRKSGIPIAYITNIKEFFSREFYVDKRVLIPRPETEELIEYTLQFVIPACPESYSLDKPLQILDLGTGSGCIASTLKLEKPEMQVYASDISKDALEVAKKNAKKLEVDIHFLQSDLLSSVIPAKAGIHPPPLFNLIIANLPYVRKDAKHPSTKCEPDTALYSGEDGLEHYRRLSKQISKNVCKHLIIEIDDKQAEKISSTFPQSGSIKIIKDLAGLRRIAHISF